MKNLVFCMVVGLALFLGHGLNAQPTLPTVVALLQSGQFAAAIDGADQIEARFPFDAAMIRARSHLELRQFAQAKLEIDRARAIAPNNSAARLLEGMYFRAIGNPRRAMGSFRRALDFARNDAEREFVRNQLRQTRSILRLTFDGNAGLIPSTNIAKTNGAHTVIVNGQPITYSDHDQTSGTGLSVTGTLGFLAVASGRHQLRFELLGSGRFFEKSLFNRNMFGIGGRYQYIASRTTKLNFGLRQQWLGDADNSDSRLSILSIGGEHVLGTGRDMQRRLNWQLVHSRQTYENRNEVNSTILNATHVWATNRFAYSLGAELGNRASNSAELDRHVVGISAAVQGKITNTPLTFKTSVAATRSEWQRRDFNGREERWANDLSVSAEISNPSMSFWGLTPVFGVSHTTRVSNHINKEFQSTDFFMGIKNAF